MPLINSPNGNRDIVFSDLYEITRCDDGLGENPAADALINSGDMYVSYQVNKPGAGSDIVIKLVNSAVNVFILAVDNTVMLDNGKTVRATGGGMTYTFSDGGGNGHVVVAYDANAAKDTYFVNDANQTPIEDPRQVILAHEMCHAIDLVNSWPNSSSTELSAVAGENKVRTERSLNLRVGDTGGFANGPLQNIKEWPYCTLGAGPSSNTDCFIVSAALRGSRIHDVYRLQEHRDMALQVSQIGAAIVRATMVEYYAFAQSVAKVVAIDPSLAADMHNIVVEPLIRSMDLLRSYEGSQGDVEAFVNGALGSVSLPSPARCERIAADVGRFIDCLSTSSEERNLAEPLLESPALALLFSKIKMGGDKPFIEWMAQALYVFWKAADAAQSRRLVPQAPELARLIDNWFANTPIPETVYDLAVDDLAAEMFSFGKRLWLSDGVRARLVQRIVAQCPESRLEPVRAALTTSGFQC